MSARKQVQNKTYVFHPFLASTGAVINREHAMVNELMLLDTQH